MRIGRVRPLKRRPHFSVVVPCYNYGRYLEECVASIVNQPDVTSKVVIIDDASTDDSFEVAQQLAETHGNVVAQRNEQNLGHIATYNRGLARVDSEYTLLLSADDLLAGNALARAGALLDANPSVGLAYGAPENFTLQPSGKTRRAHSWSIWSGEEWIEAQCRRGLSIIYSPEAVVRTSVLHAAGYYDPSFPHTADLDLWLRIAARSAVGRVNGPVQAYRRIHGAGMMTVHYDSLLVDLVERARTYEHFLTALSSTRPGASRLLPLVHRRLSLEALAWAAEHDADSPEAEVRRYVELGKSLCPTYARLAGWHEYANRHRPHVSLQEHLQGLRGRINREIGSRVRWHRWVHLGV
jgi:glycosyltransferase involved in cell wall biosynthesis